MNFQSIYRSDYNPLFFEANKRDRSRAEPDTMVKLRLNARLIYHHACVLFFLLLMADA